MKCRLGVLLYYHVRSAIEVKVHVASTRPSLDGYRCDYKRPTMRHRSHDHRATDYKQAFMNYMAENRKQRTKQTTPNYQ